MKQWIRKQLRWPRIKRWTQMGLLFGALALAAITVYYVYPLPPSPIAPKNADPATFLNVFIPGIFSALLVVLYLSMSGIQRRQAKLQETQTELDQAKHKPHINIEKVGAEGDIIKLSLNNIGEGIAERLSVVSHVYFQKIGRENNGIPIREPNYRNRLSAHESMGLISSLSPDDESQDGGRIFLTKVYVPSQEYDGLDEQFSSVMRSLDKKNTFEDIYLQIELQYDHQMPNRGRARQFLQPLEIDFKNGYTVENVMTGSSDASSAVRSILNSDRSSLRFPQTTYFGEGNQI